MLVLRFPRLKTHYPYSLQTIQYPNLHESFLSQFVVLILLLQVMAEKKELNNQNGGHLLIF